MKRIYPAIHLVFLELKRIFFGIKYFAEFDVTDNCNLRCKHCYHFHGKDDFKSNEIPLALWEERFNQLYMEGIRFILLVGGEPALRKDVLMLADQIFPCVHTITNGTLKIPREFNHPLFVSLDGLKDSNDSNRGEGVFLRILENYSGDDRVILNMTIMKENYHELEDVVSLAIENGFRGVVCNIYTPTTSKKNTEFIIEDRSPMIKELKRVKSLYPNDLLLSRSMIKWYEYPDHRDACPWRQGTLHLDVSMKPRKCFSNSDCSNCGCFAGSIQTPIKTLWRHPKEMISLF